MSEPPELTVKQHSYWAWVNLDQDGTPLDMRGDRMVEIAPGVWQEALLVDALKYLEQHMPAEGD